jgi:hypothetical protein
MFRFFLIGIGIVLVRTILDTTKNPQRPADVPHTYDDKFALVERATLSTISALLVKTMHKTARNSSF